MIHVNGAILVFLFLTAISTLAYLGIRRNMEAYLVPNHRVTVVSVVDLVIESLWDMVEGILGHDAAKYFPFIASLFIFILGCNFLGLLPLSAAPTSNVNTTFALGISAFVYYNVMGIREHGLVGYLKHFLMGLGPAGVLVAILEIASQMVRPLSLGVRLFVNMHVDHTVVLSFQNLCAWLLPVPLLLFGIVVATIQAFVFAVLTAIYVQMATEHEH
jgi:F-type H+-transporting ATPase subunit a